MSAASTELRRGLTPGYRFRCEGCGNVTRFDVVATTRTQRYHHFDLAGTDRVEEEEILAETIEAVTCRWCGRDDGVRVEVAPGAAPSDRPADAPEPGGSPSSAPGAGSP